MWLKSIFVSLVIVLLVSPNQVIGAIETCDADIPCVNTAQNCSNQMAGDTQIGVNCGCPRNTFGSACQFCVRDEAGTSSIVRRWDGNRVATWILSYNCIAFLFLIAFISYAAVTWRWSTTNWPMVMQLFESFYKKRNENAAGLPSAKPAIIPGDVVSVPTSAAKGDKPNPNEILTAKDLTWIRRPRKAPPIIRSAVVPAVLFAFGIMCYVSSIHTANIFMDHKRLLYWGDRVILGKCQDFGGWIWTGMACMITAGLVWNTYKAADLEVLCSIQRAKEDSEKDGPQQESKGKGKKKDKDRSKRSGVTELLFGLINPTANFWERWRVIFITFCVILSFVRIGIAQTHDERQCCDRTLTVSRTDYGFNILAVILLGYSACLTLYIFLKGFCGMWYLNPLNFSDKNLAKGRDPCLQALTEAWVAHEYGSPKSMFGKYLLMLAFAGKMIIEASAVVFLAMDIDTHRTGKLGLVEPLVKFEWVFLAVFLHMLLQYLALAYNYYSYAQKDEEYPEEAVELMQKGNRDWPATAHMAHEATDNPLIYDDLDYVAMRTELYLAGHKDSD